MKSANRVSLRKWSWACAIVLVFIVAFTAGCTSAGESGQVLNPNDIYGEQVYYDSADTQTIDTGDENQEDDEWDDEWDCCHSNPFEDFDFDMVVATVNGMDITAGAAMSEIEWAVDRLMLEYMMTFPDDTAFDFNRIFRGDSTFGRVLLEEAVDRASLIALYLDYAEQHSILWDEWGQFHPVIQIVFALIEDPDMFADFDAYMAECTFALSLERADELLTRVLAGEDFSALIETYGEDPGMRTFPEGYTFVQGDMVPEFENATLELEIGEISGLVISDFGIHIIKRVEPDPDNIMPNSRAAHDVEVEDLLGAKHILIMDTEFTEETLEDRMFDAVFEAFEAKLGAANIVFFAALDDIPLG